jgi:hypothetical protein
LRASRAIISGVRLSTSACLWASTGKKVTVGWPAS